MKNLQSFNAAPNRWWWWWWWWQAWWGQDHPQKFCMVKICFHLNGYINIYDLVLYGAPKKVLYDAPNFVLYGAPKNSFVWCTKNIFYIKRKKSKIVDLNVGNTRSVAHIAWYIFSLAPDSFASDYFTNTKTDIEVGGLNYTWVDFNESLSWIPTINLASAWPWMPSSCNVGSLQSTANRKVQ